MAFYRITAQGHLIEDETCDFTWHVQAASGHAGDIVVTAEEALTLLWSGPPTPASSIQQLVPLGIGIDQVVVDELDGVGRNVEQAIGTLALIGTNVGEVLPPQCSVRVSTRTALPTRGGRGGFYLCPYAVDTVSSGRLTSAARASTAAAAKAALDHLNAGGWTPVIYHRGFNTSDDILAIDVGNVFDNQRRRRNQLVEVRTRLALA